MEPTPAHLVRPHRIAFLGPPGTFSESALLALARSGGPLSEGVAAVSVTQALALVRAGEVDAAVVPLENSVEGPVAATLDALADLSAAPLRIWREVTLEVSFALLARRGTPAAALRSVVTHPHAAAQCRGWLARELPQAEVLLVNSTAAGAAMVAAGEADAAVAAPAAAATYDLAVLAEGLADSEAAVTRFVQVARPGPLPEATGDDVTTVVAYIREDHPGALLELLTELAVRGVNLSRIESRPTRAGLGRYCFSMDWDGHLCQSRVADALAALHRTCAAVRYLGSYPRSAQPPASAGSAAASERGGPAEAALRPGVGDADFAAAASWIAGLRAGRE